MDELKKYDHHINKAPNFVMLVRNSFTSKVSGSALQKADIKAVQKALKTYKKSKRLKIMEKYMIIRSEVTRWEDVIPAVNKFMDYLESK